MEQSIAENWPIYFKDLLITKDPKNNVGIVTLWTKKQTFQELSEYNTIGNLYSLDGINYLLKNLAGNRYIRYLIICGSDLSGTGQKLLNLFQGKNLELDKNITNEELEKLRKNVEIINLIGINDQIKIENKIKELKQKEPYDDATIIAETKSESETFPVEDSTIIVREEKIADAWLKVLKTILSFGTLKDGDHGTKQKEILNLITVTNEDLNNKYLPEFLELTANGIEEYSLQITTNKSFEGVHYTYGQRFFSQFKVDQIQEIIKELTRRKGSRRAYATTWDVNEDAFNPQPPCVTSIQATIKNEKLYLTAYIRSNDMFKAWPLNSFGLRSLQNQIAEKLNVKMGTLTIISNSAHIYENDLNSVKKKIENYKPVCKPDPRGNLVVNIENEKIKVTRLSPEGIKLKEYFAENAKEMYDKLEQDLVFSQTIHAVYLGTELQKAEIALKNKIEYCQDVNLEIKKNN